MTGPVRPWLTLAVVVGVLAAGLQDWVLPYDKADLPAALLGPGLVAVAVIAALLVLLRLASAWQSVLVMSACPMGAIALRVLVETSRDPTSHNLWPFELVIGFLAGIAVVLPGMLLGMALRWVIEGDRS